MAKTASIEQVAAQCCKKDATPAKIECGATVPATEEYHSIPYPKVWKH